MFFDECRAFAGTAWNAYEHHPWIEAFADGSLTKEQFVYFQVNDAPHIIELHRVLSLGLAKAPTGSSWSRTVSKILNESFVADELRLKREILAGLGVIRACVDRWEATPSRDAYANHLVRVAWEGSIGDIAAALLPCTYFTRVIGKRFAAVPTPGPSPWKRWAAIYASKAFNGMAEAHEQMIEEEAQRTDEAGRQRMRWHFLRSTQYQIGVFDAAWRTADPWPGEKQPST